MLLLSHTYKRHTTSPFYNLGLGISLKNLDDLAARCSCSRYFERTFKIPKWQFSTLFFCTSASEIPTLLPEKGTPCGQSLPVYSIIGSTHVYFRR